MRKHVKKNIVKVTISILIGYLLLRASWNSASFNTFVSEKPHEVWEFVSDLSNAKLLNPSMSVQYKYFPTLNLMYNDVLSNLGFRYAFDIVQDKGNYDHWEYGAVIYETMSYIPILTNVNYADFTLKTSPSKDHYKILGKFKTCFFRYACRE